MTIQKKQLFLILAILFAVIGIIGAGCLKNSDDGTANDSKGFAASEMDNTINDTANDTHFDTTSDTPDRLSDISGLPDVIYATQSSGGGNGRSSTPPASPAVLNDQYVVADLSPEEDGVVKWSFYIPSDEVAGKILTLTMPGTITESGFDIISEDLIASVGTGETDSSFSGNIAKLYFKNGDTTPLDTADLIITIGDIDYEISFYASAIWKASATSGGSFSLSEIALPEDDDHTTVIDGGTAKNFFTEKRIIKFTLTPNSGYVGLLEVTDSDGNPIILIPKGLNNYETSEAVTSQTYTVKAFFETAATGMYEDETAIAIEQNLNSQTEGKTIYLYVPAVELGSKKLKLNVNGKILSNPTDIDNNIIDAVTYSGSTLTITMKDDLDLMQLGGIENPDASFTVVTSTGTYNVSILASVILKFEIPEGYTLTSTGELNLPAGTYDFIADVGTEDTFNFVTGELKYVKISFSGGFDSGNLPYKYTFSESRTYKITLVKSLF